jgi:hypothetical protein
MRFYRLIYSIALIVISFIAGYLLCNYYKVKKSPERIRIQVDESGINWNMFRPPEYNIFLKNKILAVYLNESDSFFYESVNKHFYLGGVLPAATTIGALKLIRKEGKYYECLVYKLEEASDTIVKYNFKNLYLIAPDSIYRLIPEPIVIELDTIRPIKKLSQNIN